MLARPRVRCVLVARGAVRRAHHAGVELAAVRRCCCTSRPRRRSRPTRDQSSADVESSRRGWRVARARSGRACGRPCCGGSHDLARVQQPCRDRTRPSPPRSARTMRGPNIGAMALGAHEAVAVLAGMRALVFAHESRTLPRRWRASASRPSRPCMLSTGRTCRQPTEACAYQVPSVPCLREHLGEPLGVLGEVLERHRAVLDERDRLPVALHRHHDVEAGLAHLPERALERRRPCISTTASGKPRSPISSTRRCTPAACGSRVVAGELDQQDRSGSPFTKRLDHRRERRVGARQLDHRAVHELHRARASASRCAARLHRLVEAREVATPSALWLGHRRQLEVDALEQRERAFAADQQARRGWASARGAEARDASRL